MIVRRSGPLAVLVVLAAVNGVAMGVEPLRYLGKLCGGGACASGCGTARWCPDDYCPKPLPPLPCPPKCWCADDYCSKPCPPIHCPPTCWCPDDYCPKPFPVLCCPRPSSYLTCGPAEVRCGCNSVAKAPDPAYAAQYGSSRPAAK